MGLSVSTIKARRILEQALQRAASAAPVPEEWLGRTAKIAEAPSKTFTVALGTALLAKATEPDIDPLALKATSGPRAYSARGLAHGVLVPAAVEFNFDLRATGREPLNNQPFFRYDRVDAMDRVHARSREAHAYLVESLSAVDKLAQHEAAAALAAFIRHRMRAAQERHSFSVSAPTDSLVEAIDVTARFLLDGAEGGKRAQAIVAAAFDLVFSTVTTGRINDPSRRVPGDIHVMANGVVRLAVESRHKPVVPTEGIRFASALREHDIPAGLIAALHPGQTPLDRRFVLQASENRGVPVTVIEGIEELLTTAVTWSGEGRNVIGKFFGQTMTRLAELEAETDTLRLWKSLSEHH